MSKDHKPFHKTPWPKDNVFNQLSEEIGHKGKPRPIPGTPEIDNVLGHMANRSRENYKRVFEWVRFCRNPRNPDESARMERIIKAFRGNMSYWKAQPANVTKAVLGDQVATLAKGNVRFVSKDRQKEEKAEKELDELAKKVEPQTQGGSK